MANDSLLSTVVTALLGGGAATFVLSAARSWTAIRGGAKARERETINDLMERARDAERDRDFWRAVAGDYGYQLRQAGKTPNPPDPVQPSDLPPQPGPPGHR